MKMRKFNKKILLTITGMSCAIAVGTMTSVYAKEGAKEVPVSIANDERKVPGNNENEIVKTLTTGGQINTGESGQIGGNTSYTTNNVISDSPVVKTWIPVTAEEKLYYSYVGQEELSFQSSGSEKMVIGNSVQGPECQKAFKSALGDFNIARTYNIFPHSGNLNNPIYELPQEVEITLEIPKILQKPERIFQMICVSKEGRTAVLKDLGDKEDSITIRTKYFYAYALCFKDVK